MAIIVIGHFVSGSNSSASAADNNTDAVVANSNDNSVGDNTALENGQTSQTTDALDQNAVAAEDTVNSSDSSAASVSAADAAVSNANRDLSNRPDEDEEYAAEAAQRQADAANYAVQENQ